MKCLVTGGAGFIGSHLVDRLVKDGHQVVVMDDLSTGRRSNLNKWLNDRVSLYENGVQVPEYVKDALEHDRSFTDVVFHLAAIGSVPRSMRDPRETHDANTNGTMCVLDQAQRHEVTRVVFASSSSVYGDYFAHGAKLESQPPAPLSPYAASKAAGEMYCRGWAKAFGLDTVSLRFFNVYGPRQRPDGPYAAVIPRFIDAVLGGRPMTICGDGEQTRDFTYVTDVVEALMLAGFRERPLDGQAINVAAGWKTSVLSLAQDIARLSGDSNAVIEHVEERPGDVRHSLASLTLADQLLGFRASVQISEGLARTVEWFRRQTQRTSAASSPLSR